VKGQTYISNVTTLQLDLDKCIGCGMCVTVCPHRVFELRDNKAAITDRDLCMECSACSANCPVEAVTVDSGVGCAAAVLSWMLKGDLSCDCCCGDNDKASEASDSCC
jgi:NAD-dependent dihydropyrimidine dehydrogenase PreA subunit